MTTTTKQPAGSKKSGAKKGAAKGGAKKSGGNGADLEAFTSGETNDNIRPDPAEGVKPASRKGATGELFSDRKIPELHNLSLIHI